MSHSRPSQLRGYGPRHASFGASNGCDSRAGSKWRLLAGIYISLRFFYFWRFLIARVVTPDADICCRFVPDDLRRLRKLVAKQL